MFGDEIKMMQVHGGRMLTKVGDSTWGAGGIKAQTDGAVVHGTRVLGQTARNQPTRRTMTASTNLTRRKAVMNGVKDTKLQDRKGGSNKATFGDKLGRNRKGRHKIRGASILTIKVVRVANRGAKEHRLGVRILTPKVVKVATYGVKAVRHGRAKALTTEVVKVVIHGVWMVTATVVKATTNGVKEHQYGARILATIGN